MEENAREAAALAIASFALKLYAELAGADKNKDKHKYKNLIFAPASAFTSLTMAWFGADGDTDAEIQKTLQLKDDADQLLAVLEALTSQIDAATGCELAVANALWAQEGYSMFPQYARVLKERLRAAAIQVDFKGSTEAARRAINAWAEEQTKGLIRDVIAPGALPEIARLLLTSAVYFKGAWKTRFEKDQTQVEPFHRLDKTPVLAPLMRRSIACRIIEDERARVRALALPYAGYVAEMVILLPNDIDGLPHLERELDAELLRSILNRLRRASPRNVDVLVPKFQIEATYDLSDALQRMGVTRAFAPELADFSGMTPDPDGLYLSAVIQKARIDVDEEGTVAAAATAMPAPAGAAPGHEPPPFRADHPFLFLLQDTSVNRVLFLGRLLSPSP
jgi:serpin B